MAPAPASYADWVASLDRFRAGDDDVLDEMERGTLDWTAGVAERWTRHLSETLTERLQQLSKRLQVALERAANRPPLVSQALLDARRGLVPLRRFARLACQPDDVRAHLEGDLNRWARQTQASLERGAQGVRHDGGLLLKTVRDTPLTSAPASPAPQPPAPAQPPGPAGARRRVLF